MANKALDPNLWFIEEACRCSYVIPVYQRPYTWEKEQIEVLLDDIHNAFKENKNTENDYYFTGTVILHDKNKKLNGLINQYEIIDGQQRITTFTLILLAIYSLCSKYNVTVTDPAYLVIKNSLWKAVQSRTANKEYKLLTLNSVEKHCFEQIFNLAYDNPDKLDEDINKIETCSRFENNLINNFNIIFNYLNDNICKNNIDNILNFADFVLTRVNLISIITKTNENKVFTMFESINSKGKKLDEIDLIKTYIFSELDEESYDKYLDLWGKLIIKTDDHLYDYLQIYIRAYLVYYHYDIKILNFKTLSKDLLMPYYKVNSLNEAFKKMMDDMYDKVDYYNMLNNSNSVYQLIKSSKLRFYFKLFTFINYKHPRALIFRVLNDYSNSILNREDTIDIIVEIIKFMIIFTNLAGIQSKYAVRFFANLQEKFYGSESVSKEKVINAIAAEVLNRGITKEKMKDTLSNIDAYKQYKDVTVGLLSLYEAISKDENGKISISFDQAYSILAEFSNTFSLDHMLVQTPDKDSNDFKYYVNKVEDSETLVLKDGNDFPTDKVVNGMDYALFTKLILNKIGNLRIYYRDKNSGRSNQVIKLKEYTNFNTYADIINREKDIVDTIVDHALSLTKVDLKNVQISNKGKDYSLPKMEELLTSGMIHIGDELYLNVSPDNSTAKLLSPNSVEYNGEVMSLNDWGCKVTGWKAIRIYVYACVVGEEETLQDKRIRLLNNEE